MTTLAKNPPETPVHVERAAAKTRDISGYQIFDHGTTGAAHALAHRLLDSGQIEMGHHALGEWLDGRSGHGSDWVHLQFHMAIFELALGEWRQACTRFHAEVLPTASTTAEALTDAPALLWRLAMTAPEPVALPWQPLRQMALTNLPDSDKPFVQVHNLLALAGAGDSAGIERWLQTGSGRTGMKQEQLVVRIAHALAALAAGFHQRASSILQSILAQVSLLGGSHAQLGIFGQLAVWSAARHNGAAQQQGYLNAA